MTDDRLLDVLRRSKAELAPDIPDALLVEIAAIEERNQYDDDRGGVLTDLRRLFDDGTMEHLREGNAR